MLNISPSIYFFKNPKIIVRKIFKNQSELQTLFDPTLNSMSMSKTIGIKIENQF